MIVNILYDSNYKQIPLAQLSSGSEAARPSMLSINPLALLPLLVAGLFYYCTSILDEAASESQIDYLPCSEVVTERKKGSCPAFCPLACSLTALPQLAFLLAPTPSPSLASCLMFLIGLLLLLGL
jgi:hypothetical protein